MRHSPTRKVLGAVVALALAATAGRAEEVAPLGADPCATMIRHRESAATKRLLEAARAARKANDDVAAHRASRAYYAESCDRKALFNMGVASMGLGKFGRAVAEFERGLRVAQDSLDDVQRGRVLDALERSKARVSFLVLAGLPSDARVRVDEEDRVPAEPHGKETRVPLEVGQHVVRIDRGLDAYLFPVDVEAVGEEFVLPNDDYARAAAPRPGASQVGDTVMLGFESSPSGAAVSVDGRQVCASTPCKRVPLSVNAAPRTIIVAHGGKSVQRKLSIDRDDDLAFSLDPDRTLVRIGLSPPNARLTIGGEHSVADGALVDLAPDVHAFALEDDCIKTARGSFLVRGEGARLHLYAPVARVNVKFSVRGGAGALPVYADGTLVGTTDEHITIPDCTRELVVKEPKSGRSSLRTFRAHGSSRRGYTSEVRFTLDADEVFPFEGTMTAEAAKAARVVRVPEKRGWFFGLFSRFEAYDIDETEVTVNAYAACVKAGRCSAATARRATDGGSSEDCNWGNWRRLDHPMNCIGFQDAWKYCVWVGKELPTRNQWTRAAWGFHGSTYPWGEARPGSEICWHPTADSDHTCPVVGVYDGDVTPEGVRNLGGNVAEWVWDQHEGTARVMGAAYFHSQERSMNAVGHDDWVPESRDMRRPNVGFRCAAWR